MFVRKFEADTLEEALKEIKGQLGPDAIILKTVTNKGFKGAFKKKKIEITAAISEKSYSKKSSVDQVLSEEQKDKFYQSDSSHISNMINERGGERENSSQGYGSMGLNRAVSSSNVPSQSSSGTGGLDAFLNQNPFDGKKADSHPMKKTDFAPMEEKLIEKKVVRDHHETEASTGKRDSDLNKRIDELERKLHEVNKGFQQIEKSESLGILQMRTSLKSLDISDIYISKLVKKCVFELNEKELEDVDLVYEFVLREMFGAIRTAMPLFSSVEEGSVVTLLVSDSSSGQSTMAYKLAALKPNSRIIRMGNKNQKRFVEKMFDLDIETCFSHAEMVSAIRKGIEEGMVIFVDYKNVSPDKNETKKFIEGLKRSFANMEVLVCLSAINSEMYNSKVINTYRSFSQGLIFTNLDLCMNYGSVFNILQNHQEVPVKFFGTGSVVPEDIEAASPERILGTLFELN